MQKTPFSFARLATISLFTLSCFGLLCFLWIAFGGSVPLQPKGYRVKVSFDDAQQLADQADVRVAGVPIGKVVAKTPTPGATAPWQSSSSSRATRRCAPTPGRSCARRRCSARPTSR